MWTGGAPLQFSSFNRTQESFIKSPTALGEGQNLCVTFFVEPVFEHCENGDRSTA